ncbi:MAG: TetR/AcrR family transcriptional regulator [Bacteroidota bacterium]
MDQKTSPKLSERKQQILDVARDLFSRKGYGLASMRDLAEELEIRPASLYSHYKSKEEILWEIAIRAKEAFFLNVLPLADSPETIEERLRHMIETHVAVIIQNINASAIFFEEWKHLGDTRRSEFAAYQKTYESSFQNLIEEGIAAGIFRKQNTRFGVLSLLSGINWIHKWYRPGGSLQAGDIAKEAADFALSALK